MGTRVGTRSDGAGAGSGVRKALRESGSDWRGGGTTRVPLGRGGSVPPPCPRGNQGAAATTGSGHAHVPSAAPRPLLL